MVKKYTTDILISGGGIPGAALAVLLGRLGLNLCVIDPYPPEKLKNTKATSRTSALMDGSIKLLNTTGVWDKCVTHSAKLSTMRIIDVTASSPANSLIRKRYSEALLDVSFNAAEIGADTFGYNIPNDVLRAALWEEMKTIPSIKIFAKAALDDYQTSDTHVTALLTNKKSVKAKLLIGADGRNSKTRELADIDYKEHDFKQKAITCLVKHSKPHNDTSTEFHTPNGPFTIVPLPDNKDGEHISSIVWVDFSDASDRFMAMDKDAFTTALNDRALGTLGSLELMSTPRSWPLKSMQSLSLISNRVALIAEAAHVMHPLGAQGLNLSLRDVAVLAETIADSARSGMDIGCPNTLEHYAKARRSDISSRLYAVNRLHSMMTVNTDSLHHLRRGGLKAINAIFPVKQAVMEQGLRGPHLGSRILSGQAL